MIDQLAKAPVVAHETHTGMVFLVGDRAYKLKKAVRTDFLDFSTPARRLAACEREIELNRRLAPDVYLGIRRLLPLDGAESTCSDAEPVVVMRRMPAARRLSTLLVNGHDVEAALRAIAHTLAALHARAGRDPEVVVDGGAEALRRRWLANIGELKPYAGAVATYAELLRRAEALLGRGESVVLDASWSDARHRRAAGRLAESTQSCLARLVCEAPAETAGRRLATRPRTASDATASVAAAMAQTVDPWPEAVRVPTDRPFAESLDLAGAVWRAAFRAVSPMESGREPLPSAPARGRR